MAKKKSKKKTASPPPEKKNWDSVLSLETKDEKLFPQLKKEETTRVKAMFDACEDIDEIDYPETVEQANIARQSLKIKDEKDISIPWSCHSINKLKSGEWLDDEIINGFIFDNLNNKDKDNHFFNTYLFSSLLSFFISKVNTTKIKKHDDIHKQQEEIDKFKSKLTEKKTNDLIEKLNHDEEKLKDFTKQFIRYTKNVADIKDKRKLFFPMNVNGNHWLLAVVFVQEGIIGYFDSFNNEKTMKTYNPFLLSYLNIVFTNKEWITTLIESPKQTNECDCGVFLCANLYYLSKNRMPNFTQKDIPNIRNFMAHFYFKKEKTSTRVLSPKKKKTSPKKKVIIDLVDSPVHEVIEIHDSSYVKKSKKNKRRKDGSNMPSQSPPSCNMNDNEAEKNRFCSLFSDINNPPYFRVIKFKNGTEHFNEHMRLDQDTIKGLYSNERFRIEDIILYEVNFEERSCTNGVWSSTTDSFQL
jgi:hypothetical protein